MPAAQGSCPPATAAATASAAPPARTWTCRAPPLAVREPAINGVFRQRMSLLFGIALEDFFLRAMITHRVADDHGREGIVVAEVEPELHAGVSATDHEYAFPAVGLAGLVVTGVRHVVAELPQTFQVGDDSLGVLASGHHQPPANVLHLEAPVARLGAGAHRPHPPQPESLVVPRGLHGLVEAGADAEVLRVVLQVFYELPLRGVLRVVLREGALGELAELLRKVKLQAVVGPLLPQGGDAVGPLQDEERHAVLLQARRHCQARRPGSDDDWSGHQHALLRAVEREYLFTTC